MKLTKISLAALVALGAFSSVASATPLEDAIKNVDLTGFARYRYDYKTTKEKTGDVVTKKTFNGKHAYKFIANFKAAFDDNFFGVLGLRYNYADTSANSAKAGVNDGTDTTSTFSLYQAYLGYKAGNTTVMAGKQSLGAVYFVDDLVATSLLVLNSDVPGLTLGALAADALENTEANPAGEADGALLGTAGSANYNTGNLYGIAAIGSYDPVAFQLWYATLEKVADLLAAEVSLDLKVSDDVSLNGKVQWTNSNADSKLTKTLAPAVNYTDGNFYSAELGASLFGFDVTGGYIGWKVKDFGTTSFTYEDQGKLSDPGEQYVDKVDYTLVNGKGNFWYFTAGYNFDKFFVGADYVQGNIKDSSESKEKLKEVVGRLSYSHSKKLKFSTWYSAMEVKNDGKKDKSSKYRFEAKYSF